MNIIFNIVQVHPPYVLSHLVFAKVLLNKTYDINIEDDGILNTITIRTNLIERYGINVINDYIDDIYKIDVIPNKEKKKYKKRKDKYITVTI